MVAVALGGIAIPFVAVTASSDTTEPGSSAPASSEPTSSVPPSSEPGGSGSRVQWLEFVEDADSDTYAGGAPLRDIVEGKRVLMIGDSIMASTSSRYGGEMCKELVPRGWEVEVDAESGRFVDFGDRVLDDRLDSEWDVAVVMLGNNYGADKEIFAEYLEDIVDRLAPRPTVLLTVTEFRPDRADVNDVIYDIAADNDNVRVVDWAGETAVDPALVGGDGLHLSNEGRAVQQLAQVGEKRLPQQPDHFLAHEVVETGAGQELNHFVEHAPRVAQADVEERVVGHQPGGLDRRHMLHFERGFGPHVGRQRRVTQQLAEQSTGGVGTVHQPAGSGPAARSPAADRPATSAGRPLRGDTTAPLPAGWRESARRTGPRRRRRRK